MQFYSVNYALEQKYFVDKEAFLQAIKLSFNYINDAQVLNYEVTFNEQDLMINLEINIKENASFKDTLTSLQESIEDSCYSLIDMNPTNIKIDIKGTI